MLQILQKSLEIKTKELIMPIWKGKISLNELNASSGNTMVAHLGITYTEIGDDYLKARMPVDERTKQPAGLLHGGASAALAETLGSVAAYFCVDREKYDTVGIEINASHLRPVTQGFVEGVARPIKIGLTMQVWEIKIFDENQRLACISRLTLAVVKKRRQE